MNKRRNTSALAICGVMLAVTLLLNYVASFHLFRMDVIFYLISGALVYFTAQNIGIKAGIVFYVAAAILSFVIVPDKAYVMFFIGVFGPSAIFQAALFKAESNERIGRTFAAMLTIVVFIILFYLFAFLIAYGGGFLVHFELPFEGTLLGTTAIIAFSVFSALVAYIVNRSLAEMINNRLNGRTTARGQKSSPGHIDLPKLYEENDE